MLVLYGYFPENREDLQSHFTLNERDTALAIARQWQAKGWQPVLLEKTWDGEFIFVQLPCTKRAA